MMFHSDYKLSCAFKEGLAFTKIVHLVNVYVVIEEKFVVGAQLHSIYRFEVENE